MSSTSLVDGLLFQRCQKERKYLTDPGAEEPLDIRKSYDLNVLVEDGGGKLKESEGDPGGLCESRGIAETKDVMLRFEWEKWDRSRSGDGRLRFHFQS